MPEDSTAVADASTAADQQQTDQQASTAEADERIKVAEDALADKGLIEGGERESGERESVDMSTPVPKLTQRQAEMAKQLGYSDEDLKVLGDKAVSFLDKSARQFDRTFTDLGKKQAELDQAIKAAKAGKGGKAGESESADEGDESEAGSESDDSEFKSMVDEDGYLDPEKLVKWGGSMQQQVGQLTEAIHGLLSSRETEQWDGFFTGLDPAEYAEYGEGPTDDLPADSPERKAREAFREEVGMHLRGAAVSGISITLRQAQQRLLPTPDPETIRKAEQDRISKGLQSHRKSGLSRRSGRSGEAVAMTAQERREKTATENLRARGLIED